MYAIQAQVSFTNADDESSSRQIPTFYVDERVQGFTTPEGAEDIAREIISATGLLRSGDARSLDDGRDDIHDVKIHVTAERVPPDERVIVVADAGAELYTEYGDRYDILSEVQKTALDAWPDVDDLG